MRIMREMAALIAVGVVALGVFVAFIVALNVRDQSIPRTELTVNWLVRITGGLLVAVTALAALVAALVEGSLDRTVPLLGGSLLLSQHWVTAVALGAVAVAVVVRDFILGWSAPARPSAPPP